MKAIETAHNGYSFRSRTEARWSVFLCKAGLEYEYEKQGYDLGGVAYLPDFWLIKPHWWLEIKGTHPTPGEKVKAQALATQSGCDAYIFVGQPVSAEYGSFPAYSFPALGSPQEDINGQLIISHLARICATIDAKICIRPDTEEQGEYASLRYWELMSLFDFALDEARKRRFYRDESDDIN